MGRRIGLATILVGVVGTVVPAAAHAAAAPKATLPPLCVRIPLPVPGLAGAQLQIGYCPS